MAWQTQKGVQLTYQHPVRDIVGVFVANQASAVVSVLLKPDKTPASEVVTLTDFTLGWVNVQFTPTLTGVYSLSLTNPSFPTADGRTTDYDILVTAGLLAGQDLLTSLDRVRTRMQVTKLVGGIEVPIEPGDSHPFDSLLNLIISEVSDEYQGVLGRTFAEKSYTEYLDGSGRPSLVLGVGPLVSVTSLESVEYEDDGAGGVTETRTIVERHTYVLAGLRTQPRYTGLGRIDFLGGTLFSKGPKRYRVICTAGFNSIPEFVVGRATEDVVSRIMNRMTGHLLSQSLGDGTISYMRPLQAQEIRNAVYGAYRLEAA